MPDGSPRCGVCGASILHQPGKDISLISTRRQALVTSPHRRGGIIGLVLGILVLVEGTIFVFLPINPILTSAGFFMMVLGGAVLLAISGVFSGTPHRSRVLNRTDEWLKDRERKKMSD